MPAAPPIGPAPAVPGLPLDPPALDPPLPPVFGAAPPLPPVSAVPPVPGEAPPVPELAPPVAPAFAPKPPPPPLAVEPPVAEPPLPPVSPVGGPVAGGSGCGLSTRLQPAAQTNAAARLDLLARDKLMAPRLFSTSRASLERATENPLSRVSRAQSPRRRRQRC